MTGELTAQGLIDFRSPTLRSVPVATFSFPGSNTRRYSVRGAPVQSSLGIFRDRITDISDIDYRLSDPRGGLQSVRTTFVVEDPDGDIRSIVQRYGQAAFRGSAVVLDYATTSPIADWPRVFTGIVDGIGPASGLRWSIEARVDDRPLVDGAFQSPRLSSIDYQTALAPNLERVIPIALGQFDSRDGTTSGSVGSVELIRLEETNLSGGFLARYLAGAPYWSHVQRVAVNGGSLSGSTWIRTYVSRNGLATTEVWLASDPGASAKVTAEIMGVGEDVAGSPTYIGSAGTGPPIVNVVRQIRWLLRNYVWSAYRSGAFAPDSAIDTATWDLAEAWAEQRRFRGSVLINQTDQKPYDTFNAFCQWVWIRAGWTRRGKLALYPFTDEDAPYYSDSRWIRYALKGSEDAFLPSYPRDRSTHSIKSNSWLVPSSGASRSVVSVRDSRVTGNVVTEINHALGVARQDFQDGYPGATPLVLSLNASRPGVQGNAVNLVSGGVLKKWRDVNWSPAATSFDFPNSYRTDDSMTAVAGNEPSWRAGGVNGQASVRFDGVNDYMGGSAGGLISTTEFTVEVVLRLLSAPAAQGATPNLDTGIIADTAGMWGLYAYTNGGNYFLEGDNFDGAHHGVSKQVNLNTWYLVRLRHFQNVLYLSINNWDEVSVASGTTTSMASGHWLGANPALTKFLNADIAAVMIWGNGSLQAQGASIGITGCPGLGLNFDVWRSLSDRYRL